MTGIPEEVIEVREVKKYFKDVKAVDGISLSIHRGEFVALLGPNGAGKTTLVEMIEGLQQPDSGEIRLLKKTWSHNRDELHASIGISLQETRFIDKLTVNETMRLFASFYGQQQERIDYVLSVIRLEEKRRSFVVNLSGGQRQRLALGISLLNHPRVLLLDEPTTGLDPNSRREIWDILMDLKKKKGTTMILTTHYMEEASYLCDRIVILDRGKVLARGTLEELLKEQNSGEIIEFYAGEKLPVLKIDLLPGLKEKPRTDDRGRTHLVVEQIAESLPLLIKKAEQENIRLESLECRRMTLDDLFIKLTGRRLSD